MNFDPRSAQLDDAFDPASAKLDFDPSSAALDAAPEPVKPAAPAVSTRNEDRPDYVAPINPALESQAARARVIREVVGDREPNRTDRGVMASDADLLYEQASPAERAQIDQRLGTGFKQASAAERKREEPLKRPREFGAVGPLPAASGFALDAEGWARRAGLPTPELLGQAAGETANTAIAVARAPGQVVSLTSDIAQLLTSGKLGADTGTFFRELDNHFARNQTVEYQGLSAQLAQLIEAGDPVGVAAFLAKHPKYTVDIALPSSGSMAIGVGGAAGAARIAKAFTKGSTAADAAKIMNSAREWGAGGANVLMNAGATYAETGDYNAALVAGVGTVIANKLTGGGAEAQLARGRVGGAVEGGLKTGAREFGQEFGESFSAEVGQQISEDKFQPGKALASATSEGTMGLVLGGGAGALSAPAPTWQAPSAADLEALTRSKGFTSAPAVQPSGPSTAGGQPSRVDAAAAQEAAQQQAENAAVLGAPTVDDALAAASGAMQRPKPLVGLVADTISNEEMGLSTPPVVEPESSQFANREDVPNPGAIAPETGAVGPAFAWTQDQPQAGVQRVPAGPGFNSISPPTSGTAQLNPDGQLVVQDGPVFRSLDGQFATPPQEAQRGDGVPGSSDLGDVSGQALDGAPGVQAPAPVGPGGERQAAEAVDERRGAGEQPGAVPDADPERTGALTADAVRAEVAATMGEAAADKLEFVDDVNDPRYQYAVDAAKSRGKSAASIEGYFNRQSGRTVVLLPNIRPAFGLTRAERARWVGSHEAFHAGAAAAAPAFGGMDAMLERAHSNPTVAAIAAVRMERGTDNSQSLATEEAMVEIGAAIVNGNLGALANRYGVEFTPAAEKGLRRLWESFVLEVNRVLRKLGIQRRMTNREIVEMLGTWRAAANDDFDAASAVADDAAFSVSAPRGANVEIAPNPDSAEAKRFYALPRERRDAITKAIGDDIIPRLLDEMGIEGSVRYATGGFEGATNPSIIVSTPNATPAERNELTRALGYVFRQKAMITFDEDIVDGDNLTTFVKVTPSRQYTHAEADALFQKIRAAVPEAAGFTFDDNELSFGNFTDLPDGEFHDRIDAALEAIESDDTFTTNSKRFESVYMEPGSPEAYLGESDQATDAAGRAFPGRPGRRAALDQLQAEARARLAAELPPDQAQEGVAFSEDEDGEGASEILRASREIAATLTYEPLTQRTPEATRTLVRRVRRIVDEELARDPSSAHWYRDNLREAMALVAEVFPDVATDPAQRMGFVAALAITSNGLSVAQNVRAAFEVYERFRETGRMPGIPYGVRGQQIVRAQRTFNRFLEWLGPEEFAEMLATKFEMREAAALFDAHPSFPVDAEVYGSIIFGPKIGHGFYSNLSGRLDAVTMDRWFFRTWSRITNTMVRRRADGTEIPAEAKISAKERAWAHEVIMQAAAEEREAGNDISPADIQAILWYYEKKLFTEHGAANEAAQPTDYAAEIREHIDEAYPDRVAARGQEQGRGHDPDLEEGPVGGQGPAVDEEGIPYFSEATDGPAEPAVRSDRRTPGADGSVEAVGIHYGKERVDTLSGSRFGTGIKGEEQRRVARATDPRIKRRVYFYIGTPGQGLPPPEAGLGPWVYRANLGNLWEPGVSPALEVDRRSKDGWPLDAGELANRLESAILDAGYDGYLNRGHNVAVVLNKDVPVELLGNRSAESVKFSESELPDFGADARRWLQDAEEIDYDEFGLPEADPPSLQQAIGEDIKRYREARPLTDEQYRSIGQAWLDIGRGTGRYTLGFSGAKQLQKVFDEMDADDTGVRVVTGPASESDRQYYANPDAKTEATRMGLRGAFTPTKLHKILLPLDADQVDALTKRGNRALITRSNGRAYITARLWEDANGNLVLNSADLRSGITNGALLYQAVSTWAYNTDRVFWPDPAGLSNKALFRRAEQMFNSAVRLGTTRHLRLHGWQMDAGLRWKPHDTEFNVGLTAVWLHDTIALYGPAQFDRVAQLLTAPVAGDGIDARPTARVGEGAVGGGPRTARRAAVTDAAISRELERGAARRGEGTDQADDAERSVLGRLVDSAGPLLYSENDVDHSGSPEVFAGRIRGALENNGARKPITLSLVPEVLQKFGVAPKSLAVDRATVRKMHFDHGLTQAQIVDLPNRIADPVFVFAEDPKGERAGQFTVITDLRDKNGTPILVGINPAGNVGHVSLPEIPTAFGRDSFYAQAPKWIRSGWLKYANKDKALKLVRVEGSNLLPTAGAVPGVVQGGTAKPESKSLPLQEKRRLPYRAPQNSGFPGVTSKAFGFNVPKYLTPKDLVSRAPEWTDKVVFSESERGTVDQNRRGFLKALGALGAFYATPQAVRAANPQGLEELVRQGEIDGVLAWIEKNAGNEPARALAKVLRPLVPQGMPVRIIRTRNGQAVSHNAPDAISHAVGVAQINRARGTMELFLRRGDGHDGVDVETILHESVHAAIMARYDLLDYYAGSLGTVGSRQADEAIAEFGRVFKEFRQVARADATKPDAPVWLREPYRNPDEFMAWALTNPEFQAYLESKSYEGKTLWQRFKEAVGKILGIDILRNDPSWFDAAVLASGRVLEAAARDPADFKAARSFLEKGVASRLSLQSDAAFSEADLVDSPEFKRWFGKSKVVDGNGRPLVVYRGEHGAGDGRIQTRFAAISFGSREAANTYATEPNDRRDTAEAPRVIPAYLRIERPFIENHDDPFVGLDHIERELGRDEAERIARKFADAIEGTGNWQNNFVEFKDVADLLKRAPGRLGELYFNAYPFFNDEAEVKKLKARGYDGAIHIGNGYTASEEEYKVFDRDQVRSAFGSDVAFSESEPFYSELRRQVEGINAKAMAAGDWIVRIKSLKGVKSDEITWSGIEEWLKLQQGKVTKEAVLGYLDANGVQVEEVMLASNHEALKRKMDEASQAEYDAWMMVNRVVRAPDGPSMFDLVPIGRSLARREPVAERDARDLGFDDAAIELLRAHGEAHIAREEAFDAYNDGANEHPATTYASYQLSGGENYRELLFKLPKKREGEIPEGYRLIDAALEAREQGYPVPDSEIGTEWRFTGPNISSHIFHDRQEAIRAMWREVEMGDGRATFTAPHFGENAQNLLAHVRFNERKDADGKRVLFIEELQSDWAQQGRERGFSASMTRDQVERRRNEIRPLLNEAREILIDHLNANDALGFDTANEARAEMMSNPNWRQNFPDVTEGLVRAWEAYEQLRRENIELNSRLHEATAGVPAGPFVQKTEAWTGLLLKRMIRYAAENGFDRIAWTTGAQQVERYRGALRNAVDKIEWRKEEGGIKLVGKKGFGTVLERTEKFDALKAAVGEAMAARIISDPNQSGTIEGDDLTISDTGMSAFYEKIVPNVANDLLKKLGGGRVGKVNIDVMPGLNSTKPLVATYTGPALTDVNIVAMFNNGTTDTWPVLLGQQLHEVRVAMREDGTTFEDAMEKFGSSELAERVGGKLTWDRAPDRTAQPGFDITPAMAEKALAGLPLFSQLDPVTEEAFRKAGLRSAKRRLHERVADQVRAAWAFVTDGDRVAQGMLDRFHGIKAAERTLGNLPAEQSAYVAARLSTGLPSLLYAILTRGAPVWRDGILQQGSNKGLLDIFKPVQHEFDDWIAWMVGTRAARLLGEGRENNFTQAEIAALIARGNGKEQQFKDVAKEFARFKRMILDVAEGAGLIDATTRPVWDQADWIPFYRVVDEGVAGPFKRQGLANQSAKIKKLTGGTSELNDPLANILMNFGQLLDASLKNHATRLAIDNLQANPDFVEKERMQMVRELIPVSQIKKILEDQGVDPRLLAQMPASVWQGVQKMWSVQAPTDPGVIRVMRDGKAEYWRVNDALLLRALTAVTAPQWGEGMEAVIKPLRAFKRILTRGVTATPDFLARNFIRDSAQAHIIAHDKMQLVSGAMKGAWQAMSRSGNALEIMYAGGSFLGGHNFGGDPNAMAHEVRRSLRMKGWKPQRISEFLSTILDTPAKLWEAWEDVGSSLENANRTAIYEAAVAAGRSKAQGALEAKDLLDFSMQGDWAVMKLLADTLPFFNARLQGLYKLGRAAAAGDTNARLAIARNVSAAVLVKSFVFLTLPSLALMALNDGEDWYEELEDWDRDTYWHLRVNGRHFRIPKPFELGMIFATMPERAYRRLSGSESTKDFAKAFAWNVMQTLAMDPVPQAFRPATEVWANRSMFTGRPIESETDEGKLPSARYSERTSLTTRAIAGAAPQVFDTIGLSPKQMEHLVRGYLGEMGLYGLNLVDYGVGWAMDAPPKPERRADEIPLIKSFVRGDPPVSTRWRTELYEMRREADQISRTIKALRDQEQDEKADALEEREADKIDQGKALRQASKELAALNKEQDEVRRDRTLTPAEKRRRLDALMREANEVSRDAAQAAKPYFR